MQILFSRGKGQVSVDPFIIINVHSLFHECTQGVSLPKMPFKRSALLCLSTLYISFLKSESFDYHTETSRPAPQCAKPVVVFIKFSDELSLCSYGLQGIPHVVVVKCAYQALKPKIKATKMIFFSARLSALFASANNNSLCCQKTFFFQLQIGSFLSLHQPMSIEYFVDVASTNHSALFCFVFIAAAQQPIFPSLY